MPEVYIKDDKTVLKLLPKLAEEIGLNESLLLMQIKYWLDISDNKEEGKYWTYQSTTDIQNKSFPFWSRSTIQRAVKSLEEENLIEIENFNKKKYDKTRWFSINWNELNKLDSVIVKTEGDETPPFQNETGSSQNETTIPKTTTKTTKNNYNITPKAVINNADILAKKYDLNHDKASNFGANDFIKIHSKLIKDNYDISWKHEDEYQDAIHKVTMVRKAYFDKDRALTAEYIVWAVIKKFDKWDSVDSIGWLTKAGTNEFKKWRRDQIKSDKMAEHIEEGAPDPDTSVESMSEIQSMMGG